MTFFFTRFAPFALGLILVFGAHGLPAAADNPTPSPTPQPTAAVTPISTPTPLTPPSALSMSLRGKDRPLPAASWVNRSQIVLRFQVEVPTGTRVVPEVEVRPARLPFTGQPTATGNDATTSASVNVIVGSLANGKTYHWQARVVDGDGQSSAWVPFSSIPGGFDFGVDLSSPLRPTITSPTDPYEGRWYNNRIVTFKWWSRDSGSGVAGYSWRLERQAHVIPPGPVTKRTSLQLSTLGDGIWFFALRAVDRAGNWSPTATFEVRLDRRPPQLTWLSPGRVSFNPYQGPMSVHFRFNKGVRAQVDLYRVGSVKPVATFTFNHLNPTQQATLTWDGKQNGRPVPRGYYFFSVGAVDHAGNQSSWHVGGITVVPLAPVTIVGGVQVFADSGKLIVISLSRQTLYAYDGTKLILQTLVTTGNPSLPTPLGHFSILAKYSPFEFISPWPPSSPYYYPPSWTNYAMLFQSAGYFIHDAPWRSAYGPGTNGVGQPGTNYGGTHGCVNVPYQPMVTLYRWTPIGTPVDVVP